MGTSYYGKLSSEKTAEENEVCRKIVSEISNFGVTQRQQLMIVYLLALEIEDVELMKTMTSFMKDLVGKQLFLAPEERDGSINI